LEKTNFLTFGLADKLLFSNKNKIKANEQVAETRARTFPDAGKDSLRPSVSLERSSAAVVTPNKSGRPALPESGFYFRLMTPRMKTRNKKDEDKHSMGKTCNLNGLEYKDTIPKTGNGYKNDAQQE
jgi:hypothetical protein